MFDVRDVMLDAQSDLQAALREVMADLVKPQMMAQVRRMWMTAPDEIKEAFKRERPEEYAALMNDLKRR